uniref:Uncharacterized protein n=1 Tax=Ditylenchus dipsaci TaxID=166011 RepID=A0A915CUF5_9BILA
MSQHHSMDIGEMLKQPRRHSQLGVGQDMGGRPLSGDFKRPSALFTNLPSFDSSCSAAPVKMEVHQTITSPSSKLFKSSIESPVTNGVPHLGSYPNSLTVIQQQQQQLLRNENMPMKTPTSNSFGVPEPKSNATITLPIQEYMKLTTGNTSAFTPQLPTHCAVSSSSQYQQSSFSPNKFECPVSSIGNSSMVAYSSTQDFHNPIHAQPTMTGKVLAPSFPKPII